MKRKFKLELISKSQLLLQIIVVLFLLILIGKFSLLVLLAVVGILAFFLYFSYETILPKAIKTVELTNDGIQIFEDDRLVKWSAIKWYRIGDTNALSYDIVLGLRGKLFPLTFACANKGKYVSEGQQFRKSVLIMGRKHNPHWRNYFDSKFWELVQHLIICILLYLVFDIFINGMKWDKFSSLLIIVFGCSRLFFMIKENRNRH